MYILTLCAIFKGSRQQFYGTKYMCLKDDSVFKVFEGAENNQPDDVAQQAAKEIKQLAEDLTEKDILFVLISGGGSALLPLPKAPLQLNEKMKLIKQLSNRGASIQEMNQVRIALSSIKGGQLAAAASQASSVISFVISDIVDDPLDLIASGPTCASTTSRKIAPEEILKKYLLWQELPEQIQIIITKSAEDVKPSSLKDNFIYVVGDNTVATSAAATKALEYDYIPVIASTTIQGEMVDLTKTYCNFLQTIYDFRDGIIDELDLSKAFPFDSSKFQHFLKSLLQSKADSRPLLLITAGEPTVKVCILLKTAIVCLSQIYRLPLLGDWLWHWRSKSGIGLKTISGIL